MKCQKIGKSLYTYQFQRKATPEFAIITDFKMLGSVAECTGGCKRELATRLALNRAAIMSLNKIWKDKDLMKDIEARLVRALVFPFATYGCETCSLKKMQMANVDSFEMWCWKRLFRIP